MASPMTPRRRRRLAALGLLVPGLGFATVAVYVALGNGNGCTASTPHSSGGCATDVGAVAVVAFPAAVVCVILSGAVLRGTSWSRWPAVALGALLTTVLAAGTLAGVVALAGDSADLRGAVILGAIGFAVAVACALPPLLLAGGEGAAAFAEPVPRRRR